MKLHAKRSGKSELPGTGRRRPVAKVKLIVVLWCTVIAMLLVTTIYAVIFTGSRLNLWI